jgi:hypothetical protein
MPHKDPEQRKAYSSKYNQANKVGLLAKKKVRRTEQRAVIWDHKRKPCTDCKIQYDPWVMDFDHVRGKKRFNLNRLVKISASWNTILEEIAKCEVVCANCHRARTHSRAYGAEAEGIPVRTILSRAVEPRPKKPRPTYTPPKKGAWPSDTELENKLKMMPAMKIAEEVGVSGSAIKRYCARRGISTPPRGFWSARRSGLEPE